VLSVKNEGGVGCYEKGIVPKERWNPQRLNLKGTYVGSGIKNVDNGKKEMTPTLGFSFGRFFSKKKPFVSVLDSKNNFKI
jgi:hypothetical protein